MSLRTGRFFADYEIVCQGLQVFSAHFPNDVFLQKNI